MTDAPRPPWRHAALAVLGAALPAWLMHWVVLGHHAGYALLDPDRDYHLAISRAWTEQGLPRSIPEVAGLGWGSYFPDKEFLFHALTGLGYRLAGEASFATLLPLLVGVLALVLGGAAARAGAAWRAGVLLVLCLVLNDDVGHRLLLLRPHLLAMAAFSGLVWALLAGSVRAVAATAGLFALAYHGVFVPAALLGLAWLYSFRAGPSWRRMAYAGAAGLLVGLLVNPYFPSNVEMGFTHLALALDKDLGLGVDIGRESVPFRTDQFLQANLALLGVLAAGVWAWRRSARHDPAPDPVLEFLLAASAVFILLALKNPRAMEYAAPLVVCLGAAAWTRLAALPRGDPLLLAAVTALALPGAWALWALQVPEPVAAEAARQAARALPPSATGRLVFNCEWHRTPYLLHERPGVRFLDILEPALLARAWPDASRARDALRRGAIPDPAAVLGGVLGAAYVLCQDPAVIDQLEHDPSFVRLHPPDDPVHPPPPRTPHVYEIRPARAAFATRLLAAAVPPVPTAAFATVVPAAGVGLQPVEMPLTEHVVSSFLDFGALLPGNTPQGHSRCVVARVPPETAAQHAGSTRLGVGGGRNVRIWLNGAPLYASDGAFASARLVQVMVPLPAPLAPGDTLDAVVCSAAGSAYLGLALSFWTEETLEASCRARPARRTTPAPEFPLVGAQRRTCLGPLAAPAPRGPG